MDPLSLFAKHFGKTVPAFLAPTFLYHFYVKWEETKDLMESLKYAARQTFTDDSFLIR